MNRHAYSLLEVILATAILAVVLLGAQSAVVIASRAIPSGTGGPSAVAAASAALGTMADDVMAATAFAVCNAADIQFTVPDRTGDGVDDTIRYVWSGVAGDPLQRIVNGGTAAVAAAGVQEFALAYDTVSSPLPTTYSDSAEMVLFAFAPSSPYSTGVVQSGSWWAQFFKPSLAADVRSWTVSRVAINTTKHSSAVGSTKAQLRPDAAGAPGSQVLGENLILESGMTASWAVPANNYTYVSGLTPGQGLWFVLQWVSDTEACDFQYKSGTGVGVGAPLVMSANSGASWSTVTNAEMVFTVYGKVNAPDAVTTQTVLTGVRCRLRTGTNDATSLSQAWRVLNQPVAP